MSRERPVEDARVGCRRSDHREMAGYSMVEILTVVAIVGIIALVTLPNMSNWYELNRLRTHSRGVAAFLKLARMRAVATNVSTIVELDDTDLVSQCPNETAGNSTMVMYRTLPNPPTKALECFTTDKRTTITAFPTTAPNNSTKFRANGMVENDTAAAAAAPNYYLVQTNRACQLVCVNTAGVVRIDAVISPCARPYGGGSPCDDPP